MNLRIELLKSPGPIWTQRLGEYVSADKKHFEQLMELFFLIEDSNYRLNQRATLILLEVEKVRPQWINGKVKAMVKALHKSLPAAQKRNLLRVLQNQVIPERLWGHAADQCFQYLSSSQEPIAVKVFSMTVLYNISQHIPEFGKELKLLIEDQYDIGSAGFKARGRRILAALAKEGH